MRSDDYARAEVRFVSIVARHRGKCSHCGGEIERGSQIMWSPTRHVVVHAQCFQAARELRGGVAR